MTPTIPALLAERARDRGDHTFLICDDDVLTYAEARNRSAGLAKGLVAAGAGKGTHIGMLHPNGSARPGRIWCWSCHGICATRSLSNWRTSVSGAASSSSPSRAQR